MEKKEEIYSVLKKDHKTVKDLFEQIEQTSTRAKKTRFELFLKIKSELTAHAEAEESLFYKPMLENKDAKSEVLEGFEEHNVVKRLLEEMSELPVEDETWMAKCTVLKEVVEHHVKEEEGEIFDTAKKMFDKEEAIQMGEKFSELKLKILTENSSVAA